MVLITCPDCTNQVSDAAHACPHCGRPPGIVPLSEDWVGEFTGYSDRVCALIGGEILSQRVESLLRAFLIVEKKPVEELLALNGMNSFYAKIHLAFCLGLLTPLERQDLNIVRGIRNDFAHLKTARRFSDAKVRGWCQQLELGKQVAAGALTPVDDRSRFTMTIIWLASDLTRRAQTLSARRRKVWPRGTYPADLAKRRGDRHARKARATSPS
jgi:DNA-binding MltR family transcriptional regulator